MYAKKLLTKAMCCEKDGCKLVAHQYYLMGLQELENLFAEFETLPSIYQSRFDEIKQHNIKLSKLINQRSRNGYSIEQIYIEEDSTGNSYKRLFGQYLDNSVREVVLHESYLRQKHQFRNLVSFLELLRQKCTQLKYVHVVTKREQTSDVTGTSLNPEKLLENIRLQLQTQYNISFTYSFDPELHDRIILLGNGIKIKLHRGLDIYKPGDQSQMRSNDFDLRKCLKNNIDIFQWESFV